MTSAVGGKTEILQEKERRIKTKQPCSQSLLYAVLGRHPEMTFAESPQAPDTPVYCCSFLKVAQINPGAA